MSNDENVWFQDYVDDDEALFIDEYDITASPNDFNVLTLYNFIESGAVKIPGFQRNYVWDRVRASKLIESLLMGIPVPQLFLYEQSRNKFLVIDGQQRLMTIYYFIKRRFPLRDRRADLRMIFDQKGSIPDDILADDRYFEDFKLKLSESLPGRVNKYHGLNYLTLGDYKLQFELRTIRNIVVKQNSPSDDDSSIYEVFNRLNTGGVNLRPQEIRTSMYHSDFYDMLYKINQDPNWRRFLQNRGPDLHMKDIEVILRGFAMLIDGDQYSPSLVRFLNKFSRKSEKNSSDQNEFLEKMFRSFLVACSDISDTAFINAGNNRFNLALYESVFSAVCRDAFSERRLISARVDPESISRLATDVAFMEAALQATTRKSNVDVRLRRARDLVSFL